MKKYIKYIVICLLLFILGIFIFSKYFNKEKVVKENNDIKTNDVETNDIVECGYNKYVITKNNSDLYLYSDDKFNKIGEISNGIELEIESILDEYLLITSFDDKYYIKCSDVENIDNLSTIDNRFNNYILFNESAVTEDTTTFYDDDNNIYLSLEKGYELPIIVKKDDYYGVEFNNRLLYLSKNEVSVIEKNNTDEYNTSGISVLNYHFIYLESEECNEIICTSDKQFREHLNYIKENNFFTPTMEELEMYIDGMIQLPKSVVITIDDGAFAQNVRDILDEYKLNGTLFLVTSWFNPDDFKSEYLEVHSHGDNIHDGGLCPGGQGGAIKCMEHDKLLLDLETSRNKLNGSKYFCYPFYEYNDYSISVLKEAGFNMAFGGEYEGGYAYVVPGINKYKLPRWVIVNYTDMDTFTSYLNLY